MYKPLTQEISGSDKAVPLKLLIFFRKSVDHIFYLTINVYFAAPISISRYFSTIAEERIPAFSYLLYFSQRNWFCTLRIFKILYLVSGTVLWNRL